MKSQLAAYRQLFRLVPGHRRLIAAFIITALLASAAEGIGVGLVIPLLEDWGEDGSSPPHGLPIIGDFVRFFQDLSLVGRVRVVAVALFFIVVLQSGLRYLDRLVSLRLQVRLDRALEQEAIEQLYRVSLQHIHQQSGGDLLTILVMHTRQAANIFTVLATAVANASILVVALATNVTGTTRFTEPRATSAGGKIARNAQVRFPKAGCFSWLIDPDVQCVANVLSPRPPIDRSAEISA